MDKNKAHFDNFYTAWNFLCNHKIYNDGGLFGTRFLYCLDIDVVKVNPKTKAISKRESLNTETNVWLESGPYHPEHRNHDIRLDCGAETFEKAIIELVNLVLKHYGNEQVIK